MYFLPSTMPHRSAIVRGYEYANDGTDRSGVGSLLVPLQMLVDFHGARHEAFRVIL